MQSGLGILSALFAIVCVYFLWSGFSLETTIDDTANLQLMHSQSLNFATGIGAGIISAILAIGAAIVGAINPEAPPE
jgi:uncharacterized membrane protein YfcA